MSINRTYTLNGDEISLQNILWITEVKEENSIYSFKIVYGGDVVYTIGSGISSQVYEYRKSIVMLCNEE